jgi:hypothetical protein
VTNAAYNLFYARRDIGFEHLDYEKLKNKLEINKFVPSSIEMNSDEVRNSNS